MGQRTHSGRTCLDIAKSCILSFMKIRQKTSRSDVYFILTLDHENFLKLSGWQSSGDLARVDDALDSIVPVAYTRLTVGLRRCFDILNMHRVRKEFETYALGRYPNKIEPAIILCLSDGNGMSCEDGDVAESYVPDLPIPGEEWYSDQFRWDYRLYGLLLRYPSLIEIDYEPPKFVPTDSKCPISEICEKTGGRAYEIRSDKMLCQCLESLSQKCVPGVVVRFLKIPENGETPQKWHDIRRMILVRTLAKFGGELVNSIWPLPETFMLDSQSKVEDVKPRSGHPVVGYSTKPMPPIPRNSRLPFDTYDLEPSLLTQYMLSRCEPQFAWYCYLMVNDQCDPHPFGYLKVTDDRTNVQMHVCVYNFPRLLALLDEFEKLFKISIPTEWHTKFIQFTRTLPSYYVHPLDKAMIAYGFRSIISEDMTKKAISVEIRQRFLRLKPLAEKDYPKITKQSDIGKISSKVKMPVRKCVALHNSRNERFPMMLSFPTPGSLNIYENSDDIQRSKLRNDVANIRFCSNELENLANYGYRRFNAPLPIHRPNLNYQPITEMGDYDNYRYSTIAQQPSLRPIEPLPQRTDTFGNPFRQKSASKFIADEGFVEGPTNDTLNNSGSPRPIVTDFMNVSLLNGMHGTIRHKGPLPSDVSWNTWRLAAKKCRVPSPMAPVPHTDNFPSSPQNNLVNGEHHQDSSLVNHHDSSMSSTSDELFSKINSLCRVARLDIKAVLSLISTTVDQQLRFHLYKQAEYELSRLQKHSLLGVLLKSRRRMLES